MRVRQDVVQEAYDEESDGRKNPRTVTHRLVRSIQAKFAARADEALETLIEIMGDDTAKRSDRINAAKTILDRGLGTPVQTTHLKLDGGNESGFDADKVSKLDSDQLDQIEQALLQIAATNGGEMIDVSPDENESDDDAKGE